MADNRPMETTPLQNEIQDRKRPFTLTKSKRVSCLQIMRFLHICQCYCILSFLPHWVEFIFFYFFFLFLYCLLFTSVLSSCAKKTDDTSLSLSLRVNICTVWTLRRNYAGVKAKAKVSCMNGDVL